MMTSHALLLPSHELRKTPRIIFHRPAILHFNPDQSRPARTVDISAEGLCIMADLSLVSGHACAVEFNAALNQEPLPLRLEGRVAYCVLAGPAGFRIGLHFPELDAASKKHIARIMSMQKF
jgi:hypothetical protein